MKERDLQDRLFRFSVSVIKSLRKLEKNAENNVISYQLIKSSTSGGANYEEAQGAVSKADFRNKIGIALKEIRESNYWLRILLETSIEPGLWTALEKESEELKKILGSIYSKTAIKKP